MHASLTFLMTWFVSHPDLNLPDLLLFSVTPAILGAVLQLRTPAFPFNAVALILTQSSGGCGYTSTQSNTTV